MDNDSDEGAGVEDGGGARCVRVAPPEVGTHKRAEESPWP